MQIILKPNVEKIHKYNENLINSILQIPDNNIEYTGNNKVKIFFPVMDDIIFVDSFIEQILASTKYNHDLIEFYIISLSKEKSNNFLLNKKAKKFIQNGVSVSIVKNNYNKSISYFNCVKDHISFNQLNNNNNDFVILIDSKIKFENDFITRVSSAFNNDKNNIIGTISPQMVFSIGSIYNQGILCTKGYHGRYIFNQVNRHTQKYRYDNTEVFANNINCLAIKANDFLLVNGFDETMLSFQDIKLSIELLLNGKHNFVINSAIVNYYGAILNKFTFNRGNEVENAFKSMSIDTYLDKNFDYIRNLIYLELIEC